MRGLISALAALPLLAEPASAGGVADGEALFMSGSRPGAPSPRATTATGVVLPATALPCAVCHGVGGAGGQQEAGLRAPAIAWSILTRPGPERPAYDEARLLRAVAQGIGADGRPLDPAMPRFALSMEDGRALIAFLRDLDGRAEPGVDNARVRLGLLVPPGGRGAAFAEAFGAALAAAAPEGVFGRRPEVLHATAADPAEAAGAVQRWLAAPGVLGLVSALGGPGAEAAQAAADKAQIPLISARAGMATGSRSFALLPGAVEEGVGLLRSLAEPDRAVVVAADPELRRLGDAIAERVGRTAESDPAVHDIADLPAAGASAALLLGLPGPEELALLRNGDLPILLPMFLSGGAAPDLAAALGRPVTVAVAVPPGEDTGAAARRLRAGPGAATGLAGRSGHAAGEVVVEALRRAGRSVTRERLSEALAARPFETGAWPPLLLVGGRRPAEVRVWLVDVDGRGRVVRGPFPVAAE